MKLDPWLLGLCSSRVLTYLVFMVYAAALPVLQREWDMSATAAGSISGGFQIGYAISLLIFSIWADRIGAKRVFLLSMFSTVVTSLLFAFFARSYYTGFILYTLIGISMGGSYTPAVMMIADRYAPNDRGRAVGFFIASTSLSYTLSLFVSGAALQSGGYRLAFLLTSSGPLLGSIIAWITMASTANRIYPRRQEQKFSKEVLQNKPALLFISGYSLHNWELLGMWAWTPAFLSACLMLEGSDAWAAAGSGSQIVGFFHLMGMTASLTMGALSDKLGRAFMILLIASISAACSFTMGWMIGLPFMLVVIVGMIYAFTAIGDSPVLSAGMTESVDPSYLGAAFALRSFVGFGAGAIAPLAFGAVLDVTNPNFATDGFYVAWGWAYCVLGLGGLGAVAAAYMLFKKK
ncbi:MAG: MFS transporter [Desulfobacterales bacterium]|jgi:MFS family permease